MMQSVVDEEESKVYPLARLSHEKLNYIEGGVHGWQFVYSNDAPLSKTIECNKVQGFLKGVQ